MQFTMRNYAEFKAAVEEFCRFLSEANIPQGRIFDSKLVVYELLGNVLQHADGGASVTAEVTGEHICLSLRAEKPFCPPDRADCPGVFAERGRGFFLIDSIISERIYTEEGELLVTIKI